MKRRSKRKMGDPLTTGELGKLVGVSLHTINDQCDAGHLKHFRIPGSKHRRIFRSDARDWIIRCKIPIPKELMENSDGPSQPV